MIPSRNLGLGDQRGQARQQFGKVGVGRLQLGEGGGGGRQAQAELIKRGITRRIHAFLGGDGAFLELELGLEGNARAELPHVADRARHAARHAVGLGWRRLPGLLIFPLLFLFLLGHLRRGSAQGGQLGRQFLLHLGAQARLDLPPQVAFIRGNDHRFGRQNIAQAAFDLGRDRREKQPEHAADQHKEPGPQPWHAIARPVRRPSPSTTQHFAQLAHASDRNRIPPAINPHDESRIMCLTLLECSPQCNAIEAALPGYDCGARLWNTVLRSNAMTYLRSSRPPGRNAGWWMWNRSATGGMSCAIWRVTCIARRWLVGPGSTEPYLARRLCQNRHDPANE